MKLSNTLRTLAARGQYGHARTPATYIMLDSYCAYYHTGLFVCDFETWQRVAKLSARYQRLCHYVREVKPGWKVVQTIHFADNSIEVVERSITGETRQRMTLAPGGDACF